MFIVINSSETMNGNVALTLNITLFILKNVLRHAELCRNVKFNKLIIRTKTKNKSNETFANDMNKYFM